MATIKWSVDPMHSEVLFKVKHLMITTVTGHFKQFQVEAETEDEQFTKVNRVLFTADINSISTNNDQRDTHLKSADFFDAEQFNELRFESTNYESVGDDD